MRAFLNRHWPTLLMFVVCPVMIALPAGIFRAGLGAYMSPLASCLHWTSTWLIGWLVSEALLRLATVLLRPWQPPFLLLLLLAGIGNILVSPLYIRGIVDTLIELNGTVLPDAVRPNRVDLLDPGYLAGLLYSGWYGMLVWGGLRWCYEYLYLRRAPVGVETMSPSASVPPAPVPEEPPSSRLTAELRKHSIPDADRIVAIQAEDHYIRVHLADGGSRLILYRFADMLSDMRQADGLQVHRSFWVRSSRIAAVYREGGALRLRMANGLVVPVSQKHQALLGYMLEQRGTPLPA